MDLIYAAIHFILHLDHYLNYFISHYGVWTYAILFLIIFCETGLVITPFLPGDTLLFAAGTVAASSALNIHYLVITLIVAALLGDNTNYFIGSRLGPKVFKSNSRWLKAEYLEKTHAYFEKYGGKTIIIARFLPILRTFAPFVAGIGRMSYSRFIIYCILAAVLWAGGLLYISYAFGNISWVRNNVGLIILIIIAASLIPALVEATRQFFAKRKNSP